MEAAEPAVGGGGNPRLSVIHGCSWCHVGRRKQAGRSWQGTPFSGGVPRVFLCEFTTLGPVNHIAGMVFFTPQLYDGMQPESGWERRAVREWMRRWKISRDYAALISPLLPASVARLSRETLHDAVVDSVDQGVGSLTLVVDARRALGGFAGRRIQLLFTGVRRRIRTRGLVGRWWLYEEAHLCSRARFSLHVMFDSTELEIEADELRIQRAPKRAV